MIRKIALALGAGTLIAASPAAYCLDGVSAEIGRGEERTTLLRIAIVDKWRKQHDRRPPEWRLAGYWELSGAIWESEVDNAVDVGFTPVFRIVRQSYYVEAALGFHLIGGHRSFSSSFQFAEHIGAGVVNGRYSLGLHLQHLSNAGIENPNPGMNFLMLRLQYELE